MDHASAVSDTHRQQWLHVSEYPPSLTYAALELGLLCVILAAPSCCSTRRVPLVSNVQGGTSELGPEVSL